jgi:hypothetical protein
MPPSLPARWLARRFLERLDGGCCRPATNTRASGKCWLAASTAKPPSSATSRGLIPSRSSSAAVAGSSSLSFGEPIWLANGQNQPARAAARVRGQLGEPEDVAELIALAELALADRPGVRIGQRHEAVGDLLAGQALGDLPADLFGELDLRLQALDGSAGVPVARLVGQGARLTDRAADELAGLPGEVEHHGAGAAGAAEAPAHRATDQPQPPANRPRAVLHAPRAPRRPRPRRERPHARAAAPHPTPTPRPTASGRRLPRPSSRNASRARRSVARAAPCRSPRA